jgi:hypothetical protein
MTGESPSAYLTRWRMDLAARRLRDTDDSLEAIAQSVGYTSVYAFSRAFHRIRSPPPASTGPDPAPRPTAIGTTVHTTDRDIHNGQIGAGDYGLHLRPLASASITWRAGLLAAEPEEALAGPERQRLPCQAVRTDRHERIVRDTKGLLGKTGGVEPIAHPGGYVGLQPVPGPDHGCARGTQAGKGRDRPLDVVVGDVPEDAVSSPATALPLHRRRRLRPGGHQGRGDYTARTGHTTDCGYQSSRGGTHARAL